MACKKLALDGGVSGAGKPGGGGYATEAECLQACKEGACCDGVTCTVKPQCQCQCTTGRCCGPDTTTAGGTTWKTCRNESKAACDARGGVFQCGVSCSQGVIGDASGSTGGSVCLNGTGDVANAGPVFKGVGTTCATGACLCCDANGKPKRSTGCSTISWCWCSCGEGSAPYPRFVSISLSFKYTVYRIVSESPLQIESKEKSVTNASVTLTLAGGASSSVCPQWKAGTDFFGIITQPIPLGGNGAEGTFSLAIEDDPQTGIPRWLLTGFFQDFSERPPWKTARITPTGLIDSPYLLGGTGGVGGRYSSGACFSNMASYQASVQGAFVDYSVSFNGVQA